ncbi:DGQHR domain-containing protein [Sphingobium sp. ba1]|uniref:DGQHR domain-containing protein n=1 Tax=Sphingobium sp. ba1 TaxID=1522072 RepID=UPI00056AB989|nr:DGQHR domain-containing protein [Sphingobium sp. ba1]
MLPPLTGLSVGDDLKPIYSEKSKNADEKTISAASIKALELKLAGEVEDGWRLIRRNKASIRLGKDKPVDRQLEDDVWCLLYRMGFSTLNRTRNFSIQAGEKTVPRQIDVFAADEETALIVECTHSAEPGPKSVKTLIDKIGAIREDVIKSVHTHFGRDPKLKVKFAIATRNVHWRAADRDRAEAAGIAIITENDLVYFNKLTDFLKTAARYQFLGRYFSGEKVEGLRVQVPATKGRAGGRVFYNFLMSPYELLRIAYISHRSKTSNDDLETYQRMVKPSRLKEIGKYIDDGGKFPTNIIINFKSDSPLKFDQKDTFGDTATGTLHLPGQYGSAWVIDGQHRLYGYAHAQRFADDRSVVPVLAYENLPIRDEIQLFVDINTQQVKVSRNLVNEIVSSLNIDDPDPVKRLEALCARIALKLDDHPTSPIKDRILTVAQDKDSWRCLTLTSLSDGIATNGLIGTLHRAGKNNAQALLPGPLGEVSQTPAATMTKAVETLSGYLALFAGQLDTHWKLGDAKGGYLCTNLGLRALLLMLRKIVAFVENKQNVKATILEADDIVARVAPYVQPVIDYFAVADVGDVNAFRQRGSSLASVTANCLQMCSIIHEAIPEFDLPEVIEYMDSRDVAGAKQAKDMIDNINRIIFENVLTTLKAKYGEKSEAWWMLGVPKSVRNSCDQMYNETPGDRERWRYLFLSNYPDIISYNDNWEVFKDHYNFYGKGKKADLIRWIGKINKARTITHHAEKGPLSKEDVAYVKTVHDLVTTFIEGGQVVEPGKRYINDVAVAVSVDEAA